MIKEFINNHKKLFTILLLALFAFLICMLSPSNIIHNNFPDCDSAVFKYIGKTIANGGIPYLDTFDHKGPVLYLINYIGLIINQDFGIWILELISMFVALLFSYKAIRLFYSRKVAFATLILSYCLIVLFFNRGNLTEEYSLPFLAISIYYFVKYLKEDKIKSSRVLICGICFALIALMRPNNAFPLMGFILFILIKSLKEKDYKGLSNKILYFLIGLLIPIIPTIIYFVCNNAINEFIDAYILFNVSYSSTGLTQKIDSLVWFFNREIIYLVLIIYLFIFINRKKIKNNLKNIYSSFVLSQIFAVISIVMSGYIYGHYGMILLPALIFPICSFIDYIFNLKKNDVALYIVLYLVFTQILIPNGLLYKDAVGAILKRQDIPLKNIAKLIKENTNEDDLITVFGNVDNVYLYSDRMSASYYSFQVPSIMNDKKRNERYYKEIKNAKIVIDTSKGANEQMNKFIKKNNYSLIDKKYYNIYLKK